MALLKCPECNHNVSDKAAACPHCGYPMNSPTSTKPRIRNGKPTKLPNGFGTCTSYLKSVLSPLELF